MRNHLAGLTEEMFFDLCQANSRLSMERDRDGNIIGFFVETNF